MTINGATADLKSRTETATGYWDNDWHLPPMFLLRVAGLPFNTVRELRSAGTRAWADEVLDAELRLGADAARISDLLATAVPQQDGDRALRRDLVNVRRDVFNLRTPDPAATRRVLDILPEAKAPVDAWISDLAAYTDRLAAGASIAEAERREAGRTLRRIATDPRLRNGILLASMSLDRYLPGYLAAGDEPLSKRSRRVERSLLEYFYRAATKTSPFSTLTTVTLGEVRPNAHEPLRLALGGGAMRTQVRLNVAELARLSAIILADATLSLDLPVAATAGWQQCGERVRYLRRRALVRDGADDAPAVFDAVRESLFSLPAGQLLSDILAIFADGRPRRLGEVATLLSIERDGPLDEVERYLRHLVRVGLLVVPNLQIDIHDPDPFATFRAGLVALDRPWANELSGLLSGIAAEVDRYSERDLAGRRETLETIRARTREAHAHLGAADVEAPRHLLYEDATLRDGSAVADRDHLRGRMLADLRTLTGILPLFDVMLPRRLATRGFFRARYGAGARCADFLGFAHEFDRDFFGAYGRTLLRTWSDPSTRLDRRANPFGMPEVEALHRARNYVVQEIGKAFMSLPAGAVELELRRGFVHEVTAALPPSPVPLSSWMFFLQLASGGDVESPLVVVNRVYSGLTMLFSRFTHLFDGPVEHALRRSLLEVQPRDTVLAEMRGGYEATNLNLHPAVLPYEIVAPGELSRRPVEEQIHIQDLEIVDDAAADRLTLRSTRLGVEVTPVYLGFLMPMALPEVQQVLLNFSGTTMAMLDLWAGADVPLPDHQTVAGYPRIRYGNVVLQRRHWKMHPDALPHPMPARGHHERFLQWQRWRQTNGLPPRVFVTPDRARPRETPQDAEDRPRRFGDHKPLYVDFDSQLSMELLDSVVRQADQRLVMTEMLPDQDQLVARDRQDGYVSELTLEMTRLGSAHGD